MTNLCYVDGDRLIIALQDERPADPEGLRQCLLDALTELVQQRAEEYFYRDPVYWGLELVKALGHPVAPPPPPASGNPHA